MVAGVALEASAGFAPKREGAEEVAGATKGPSLSAQLAGTAEGILTGSGGRRFRSEET